MTAISYFVIIVMVLVGVFCTVFLIPDGWEWSDVSFSGILIFILIELCLSMYIGTYTSSTLNVVSVVHKGESYTIGIADGPTVVTDKVMHMDITDYSVVRSVTTMCYGKVRRTGYTLLIPEVDEVLK